MIHKEKQKADRAKGTRLGINGIAARICGVHWAIGIF